MPSKGMLRQQLLGNETIDLSYETPISHHPPNQNYTPNQPTQMNMKGMNNMNGMNGMNGMNNVNMMSNGNNMNMNTNMNMNMNANQYQYQVPSPHIHGLPQSRKSSMTSQSKSVGSFFRRKGGGGGNESDEEDGQDGVDLNQSNITFDEITHIRDRGPYGSNGFDTTPIIPTLSSIPSKGSKASMNNVQYRKQMTNQKKLAMANAAGGRAMSLNSMNPMAMKNNGNQMGNPNFGPNFNPNMVSGPVPGGPPRAMSLNRMNPMSPLRQNVSTTNGYMNPMGQNNSNLRANSLTTQRFNPNQPQFNGGAGPQGQFNGQYNPKQSPNQQQGQFGPGGPNQFNFQKPQIHKMYTGPVNGPSNGTPVTSVPGQRVPQQQTNQQFQQTPQFHQQSHQHQQQQQQINQNGTNSNMSNSSDSLANVDEDHEGEIEAELQGSSPTASARASVTPSPKVTRKPPLHILVSPGKTDSKLKKLNLFSNTNNTDSDEDLHTPVNSSYEKSKRLSESNLETATVLPYLRREESPRPVYVQSPLQSTFEKKTESRSRSTSNSPAKNNTATRGSVYSSNDQRKEDVERRQTRTISISSVYSEEEAQTMRHQNRLKASGIYQLTNTSEYDDDLFVTASQFSVNRDVSSSTNVPSSDTKSFALKASNPTNRNSSIVFNNAYDYNEEYASSMETLMKESNTYGDDASALGLGISNANSGVNSSSVTSASTESMHHSTSSASSLRFTNEGKGSTSEKEKEKENKRKFSLSKSKIFRRLSTLSSKNNDDILQPSAEIRSDISSAKSEVITIDDDDEVGQKKVTFSKEELGIMNSNYELLNELELVSQELAAAIKREFKLESQLHGLRNVNSKTGGGSNRTSLSVDSDDDSDLSSQLLKKNEQISDLVNQLNTERRLRFISEEHVLLMEHGITPSPLKLNYEKNEIYKQLVLKTETINQLNNKVESLLDQTPQLQREVKALSEENHDMKNNVIPNLRNKLLIAEQENSMNGLAERVNELSVENHYLKQQLNHNPKQLELEKQRDALREGLNSLKERSDSQIRALKDKNRVLESRLEEVLNYNGGGRFGYGNINSSGESIGGKKMGLPTIITIE